jgi:hypothetical protein
MNFVDLARYFVPLNKDQEPSLDAGRHWGPRIGGWLSWNELIRRRRVILLAEADSGKTEEFRNQCKVLNCTGRSAFFLRIEELPEQGSEAALDRESATRFDTWLAGSGEGWFFLDSVDEARLNRKSFDAALKRFTKDIGTGLERAHVYVSCRVTDWKGVDDRATFARYLPPWQKPVISAVAKPEDYTALLNPLFEKRTNTRSVKKDDDEAKSNDLVVVQLVPLSEEQYRALAAGAEVPNVDQFVQAISQNGLATLAERPGDLLDLADYWKSHGRFSSFADMLDHSISRKLTERDAFRPDNETISPEEAREGAERLAGALTFGKSFTLRAPGHDPDPSLAAGALDAKDILPDWTDARRNALLRRGIFVPATYGRIRFHHRTTQEYLAARWLHRLLNNNCPRAEIFQLLFAERYGVETVVPSLRAEAAWLSLWHPDIQSEIIRREPLTLVAYGDPGSLSISARQQLLQSYAVKEAAAQSSDERLEPRALWMFADEQLAPAIRKAWQTNSRDDFRFDLLRLIREGAVKGAASLARPVALGKTANEHHRIVAVQAAAACGDDTTLAAVAKSLLRKPETLSPRLASSLSLVLYPNQLTTSDLLKIIEKSQPPSRYSAEGFGYHLKELYAKAPDQRARAALLGGLADLCLTRPFADDHSGVSKRFADIAKHLHDLALSEASTLGDKSPPRHLVRTLMVVERAGREGFTADVRPQLQEIVRGNPTLNRELFWADVAEQRANCTRGPITRHWHVYFSGNAPLWSFSERDLVWLNDDLKTRPNIEDRQIALSVIVSVLQPLSRLAVEEGNLREMIGTNALLLDELQQTLTPQPEDTATRELRLPSARYDREAKANEERNKKSWIKFRTALIERPTLLSDPSNLSSWKAGIFRLHYVTNWLTARTGADTSKAAIEWRLLEEAFNRPVAEAYRDGMKRLWQVVAPARPVRNPGGGITKQYPVILAFAGIGVDAAEDVDWASGFAEKEAALAARHGCDAEENYPEWIDSLVMSWPKSVLPVVKDRIELEWAGSTGTITYFLNRYSAPAYSIQQPVQRLILSTMRKREAKSNDVLRTSLKVIRNLKLDATERAQLFATAKARHAAHVKAKRDDFALSYLALMLMLDPNAGLAPLAKWMNSAPKSVRQTRAEHILGALFDRYDPMIAVGLTTASTATLEALLRLAYSHIHPKDDAVHEGSFTPDGRDHAENARNSILSVLLDRPGADAYWVMERLASDPIFALRSHRFHELARGKAERDAEPPAWTTDEALRFQRDWTAPVKTGSDLLRVAMAVLEDIARNLTHGDVTSRPLLERAKDEDEVQNWLVEQMNARARGRFQAFREAEVATGDKPDIILASASAMCEVAIEVKHGGKGWTARDLEQALRSQLAEDYLKPESRRHGVLVITHHRDRRWLRVSDNKPVAFSGLIAWLSEIATTITQNAVGPIVVKAIGINAWKGEGVPVAKNAASSKTMPARRPTAKKRTKAAKEHAPRRCQEQSVPR